MAKGTDLNDKRILIVSDSKDELNDLRHLLVAEFGEYMETDDEGQGLELFMKHHPSLLILAFRSLARSEEFYLGLYRKDTEIHSVMHQTLLLCRSTESKDAYALCKKGTIDDYVADRPLYDPFRLRLCVAQALKRRSQAKYSESLTRQFSEITARLQEFDRFMRERLVFGGGEHRDTLKAFDSFTQTLVNDLKGLEDRIVGHAAAGGEGQGMRQQVSREFNQFREQSVEKGRREMQEQLNRTNRVLDEINSGYADYAHSLEEQGLAQDAATVMLVDDDEIYRDILASMLREEGFNVLEAGDGATALAGLRNARPDVVLLDYWMPGIDGVATLREIKSRPQTRDVPVIMLTGASARDVVSDSVKAGAEGFVVKPSDRTGIVGKINKLLGRDRPG